ncbi:ankyrin repeat-containing domain protein [Aspergillus pseudonomiae]|uniref:Ankyrin repeat-containing domain protein n=1 Tax=Aspergillus pseudonomiae TaxID=1506151 RepID=A0A5N6IBY3_9EURO|nr:ankyrin repeat-containing domain protein [Aspergillus pseudonomiae]KAB8264241.1 ankyrin repeat-containing domain protein [Aspergillus pseudonomiae]KAE8405539.1 ankyrin repeat-containing domain protein [Aspergillus pseudonomiae]
MAEWEYDDFDDFDDGLDEFGIGYGLPMADIQTTPLHTAARQRNISQVESYLSHGANVNTCDGQGRNVLQVAILQENNEGIIRLLLRYGADVIGCSGPHGNALVHAVRANSSIIQLLLDHIASQGSDYHTALESALYYASETGQLQSVRILLARGANPNARGPMYGSAIQAAAHYGSEEIVQTLLDAGAQVNAQGGYHGNALQAAARYGQLHLVQMLLKAGADVNAQGGVDRNALTAATVQKHIEVANILLQAGAKDDMSEHEGLSDVNMPADIGLDLFEYVHY